MRRILLVVSLPLILSAQALPPQPQPGVSLQRGPGRSRAGGAQETQQVRPEDLASVEGQVTNASTGEPLNKATLTLRRADARGDLSGGPRSYTATTATSGQFSFSGVAPGRYDLSATRNGFVDADYGSRDPQRSGQTLTVNPKQRLTGLLIAMTPHAVVTGRVLDQDGDPLLGARVEALRYRYFGGRKQLLSYGDALANDLGEYRIFGLPPGRYFVRAATRRPFGRAGSEQPEEQFAPVYYPGSADPTMAALIEVGPGGQVRGVDLTLSKRRMVRVKGRVTNAAGAQRLMVFLRPRPAAGSADMSPAMVDRDGNFEIRGVAPGSYYLIARTGDRTANVGAKQVVEIGNTGADDMSISLQSPIALSGGVRIDGQATASLTAVQVTLRARDAAGPLVADPKPAQVQANGSFTVMAVSPDEYQVAVSNLPDGFYVKAILAGGRDISLTGLDLSSGAAIPLDVVLSAGAGVATGVVQNGQDPAPGATVVLVPQERERRDLPQYYRTAVSDDSGNFSFKNLYPGQYKAYAWKDVETGAWFDPDFIRPVESKGESVTVRENSTETVQLKLTGV